MTSLFESKMIEDEMNKNGKKSGKWKTMKIQFAQNRAINKGEKLRHD